MPREPGVLCAGGCGLYVMPATANDCAEQSGPWYCPECFIEEGKRRLERAERAERGDV